MFIKYCLFVSFILAVGWQKRVALQAETWAGLNRCLRR